MSVTCTGIDPSTTSRCHYATVVLCKAGGRPKLGLYGTYCQDMAVTLPLCNSTCVEVPGRVHRFGASMLLLKVAFEAGRLVERHVATPVAPEDWRKWLTGKRGPKDAEIRRCLEARIDLPRRTNSHVRDAIGIALYGLHLLGHL